ncbi:MAG: 3-hydroxyacyl-CoA dehydrogenase NAD-binding domain-containing protein, partial [Candidatus Lokiarchaeota archaeon]
MIETNRIKNFAVIGAGTMGREIAQVALMAGFEKVRLFSRTQETLDKALSFIRKGLLKMELKGLVDDGATNNLLEKLLLVRDIEESVDEADIVIESVPEKMELKQEIFSKLGKYAPKHAFTPIPVLRLIEVIKGENTSIETFETAIKVGEKLPALKGKRYIAKIEKESPGFIVNRLTITSSLYTNWLLDEATEKGIPYENVDHDFVDPPVLGPFAKWDYFGLDVVQDTMNYFAETISPEFKLGKTLKMLLKEGNLGRKTGKGIYKWSEGKPIITQACKAGLGNNELYYAIQLNEGCRLLEEGIVTNYKTIDDTMLAGMDLPGPFGPGKRNYKKWSELLEVLSIRSG